MGDRTVSSASAPVGHGIEGTDDRRSLTTQTGHTSRSSSPRRSPSSSSSSVVTTDVNVKPHAQQTSSTASPPKNLSFGISRILGDDSPKTTTATPLSSSSSSSPSSSSSVISSRLHEQENLGRCSTPPPPEFRHGQFTSIPGLCISGLGSSSLTLTSLPSNTLPSPFYHSGFGAGVIKVPAHRPNPMGSAFPPMVFPWMQERKDRLTGRPI